jgi:peptidoglycan/LPS O-acetylase OafA/YrhL
MVMLRHYGMTHFYGGFLGVDLFFVLSGFLITRLLLAEFEASSHIRFDLFYLRRACRLLPAIIVLLTLVGILRVLMPVAFHTQVSYWFSVLAVLFFFANVAELGNIGHTWSLSVEEQFYFLWPMTLLVLLRRCRSTGARIAVVSVLVLAAAVLRAWLQSHGGLGINVYCNLFTRMDSLLIGTMVALAEGLAGFPEAVVRFCRYRPAEIAMAIFLLAVFLIKDQGMPYMFAGGLTIFALIAATLITCLIYEDRPTPLKRFLEWHPMVWLGRRSYGIYLYHLPVFYMLQPMHEKFRSQFDQFGYLALGFGLPVVLAALSYHYVEMPFLKRKVHLKWNFSKPEAVVPSVVQPAGI